MVMVLNYTDGKTWGESDFPAGNRVKRDGVWYMFSYSVHFGRPAMVFHDKSKTNSLIFTEMSDTSDESCYNQPRQLKNGDDS